MATQFIHNGNRYMINDRGQGYRVEKETRPGPWLGASLYIEDTDCVLRAYRSYLASVFGDLAEQEEAQEMRDDLRLSAPEGC